MLWSLVKVVLFVALIAAATLGAGYLMETDGGIRVSVANTEFNLGPLQAVIAMIQDIESRPDDRPARPTGNPHIQARLVRLNVFCVR